LCVVQRVLYEFIERVSLYPPHLQDRVPLSQDKNALLKIFAFHHEGELRMLSQVFTDGAVALSESGDFADKAFHRPRVLSRARNLVGGGEVTRARHGPAHRIRGDMALSEAAVGKAPTWILNRLVVGN